MLLVYRTTLAAINKAKLFTVKLRRNLKTIQSTLIERNIL